MGWNLKNFRKKIFIFGIFGSIQFVVLSTIAMFFYAGGTQIDPSSKGYSFWFNYFSDLGLTVTYSGAPNTVPLIMFVTFFFIWGSSIIALFVSLPSMFLETRGGRWISIIGGVFAIIVGMGIIGLVIYPADIEPLIHSIWAAIHYLALMVVEICTAIAIFLSKSFPKKYGLFLLISAIIISISIIIFLTGPILFLTPEWLATYVMEQKIMTYTFLAAIGATAYCAWKLSSTNNN
jgi:hypothetical protein